MNPPTEGSDVERGETVNTNGLHPHPARAAAGMPIVKGLCPSCGARSLFLATGGHITCAMLDCSDPCAASTVLRAD